jgi:hypothetical protein
MGTCAAPDLLRGRGMDMPRSGSPWPVTCHACEHAGRARGGTAAREDRVGHRSKHVNEHAEPRRRTAEAVISGLAQAALPQCPH